MNNRIELLAPAGDPEKLKIAVEYGADAVYFGGEDFSLRSQSDNSRTTTSGSVWIIATIEAGNAISH